MKTLKLTFALAAMSLMLQPALLAADDSSSRDRMISFLKTEGYSYDVKENIITFKYEGSTICFTINKNKNFFQISYLFSVKNMDRTKVLELCNKYNNDKGIIKFAILGTSAEIGFETDLGVGTSNSELREMLGIMVSNAKQIASDCAKLD